MLVDQFTDLFNVLFNKCSSSEYSTASNYEF